LWGLRIVFDRLNSVVPDPVYFTHERFERAYLERACQPPRSRSSSRHRIVKRQLYSTWGVSEYWLLDPEDSCIEVSRKRKEGGLKRSTVLQAEDELTSTLLPGFHIKVAQLFK
jgi:hypothetical protein